MNPDVVLSGFIFYHEEVIKVGTPNQGVYDPYEDGFTGEQAEEIKAWEESGRRFREDMKQSDDEPEDED